MSIHDHKDVLFAKFCKVKLTHNPKFQSVLIHRLNSMNVRLTPSSLSVNSVAPYCPNIVGKKYIFGHPIIFLGNKFSGRENYIFFFLVCMDVQKKRYRVKYSKFPIIKFFNENYIFVPKAMFVVRDNLILICIYIFKECLYMSEK